MARLLLRLLGGFEACLDGRSLHLSTRKAEALLAYLALHGDESHPRDKLAALFWGDASNERARASLRQTLRIMGKSLGPELALVADTRIVSLPGAEVETDVAVFERDLSEGTPESLERAAGRYRGDLLEGLTTGEPPFEDWLLGERERLRELGVEACASLLAHHSRKGDLERAIHSGIRLLALDPLQEVAHRALMRLYAKAGRRGAALRQYQACVEILQRELGVEPEPETRDLYQEILRQRRGEVEQVQPSPAPPPVVRLLPHDVEHETPLLGRAAPMASLSEGLERSLAGAGGVAVITGEAGIGKTRVIMELTALAQRSGARLVFGRCYESARVLPFGPWVDALRATRLAADSAALRSLDPVWRAELARLLPEIGAEGLPSATNDPLRLFDSVAHLVAQLASERPVVLVFEDLHWADEVSLRLLAFLARRLHAMRAFLAVTLREEELDDAPELRGVLEELGTVPELMRLPLAALSRPDVEALVRTLARTVAEPEAFVRIAQQVWALSEGNPFVTVETMRAFQQGALAATGDLAVPKRVREVIARRLERLSERARQLTTTAAVIGREFEFALLQRACELSESEAAEGVEELVRRRILRSAGDRFDFRHERIREVVGDGLLPLRRKIQHGLVAKALESLYAQSMEAHCAETGGHFLQAETWDKAAHHLHDAGRQAAQRKAHREAVAFYEQALAALARLPETGETIERAIELRFSMHHSLLPLGQMERWASSLEEALRLAEAAGDEARLARAACHLSDAYLFHARYDDAIALGLRALALGEKLGQLELQVCQGFYLGAAYHVLGALARAVNTLEGVLDLIPANRVHEAMGAPFLPGSAARLFLAWSHAERGEFDQALTRVEEMASIARATDHPWSRAEAPLAGGIVLALRGSHEAAAEQLRCALAALDAANIVGVRPYTAAYLGWSSALGAAMDDAIPLLESAVAQAEAMGFLTSLSRWLSMLGDAYRLAGRFDEATPQARRALELSRRLKERGNEAWALWLLGEIAAGSALAEAEGHYREAMALAAELEMKPLVARCQLGLGALSADRALLRSAVDLFEAMGMSLWLELAQSALRQLSEV